MASVTLGQHPASHHLDSDQQLLQKLKASDRKKFTRKWSLEKIMRHRPSDADSARVAVSVLLNHEQPSASPNRACDTGSPRSAMDARNKQTEVTKSAHVDTTGHALQQCRLDRENANNNNGIFGKYTTGNRRSSMKDTGKSHSSLSLRELDNSSQSASSVPDELEGLQLDRLTQARSGVVKMRSEPLRREAWSIFNQKDPRVRVERGEGHNFTSRKVKQDWCDACNRHITSAAFKCQSK